MALAAFALLAGARSSNARSVLWALMLAFPFPFIATTAGWMTAELGRQPWVVYGLLRTADGTSPTVHSGDVVFSTLGFMGLYFVVGFYSSVSWARRLHEARRGPSRLSQG